MRYQRLYCLLSRIGKKGITRGKKYIREVDFSVFQPNFQLLLKSIDLIILKMKLFVEMKNSEIDKYAYNIVRERHSAIFDDEINDDDENDDSN